MSSSRAALLQDHRACRGSSVAEPRGSIASSPTSAPSTATRTLGIRQPQAVPLPDRRPRRRRRLPTRRRRAGPDHRRRPRRHQGRAVPRRRLRRRGTGVGTRSSGGPPWNGRALEYRRIVLRSNATQPGRTSRRRAARMRRRQAIARAHRHDPRPRHGQVGGDRPDRFSVAQTTFPADSLRHGGSAPRHVHTMPATRIAADAAAARASRSTRSARLRSDTAHHDMNPPAKASPAPIVSTTSTGAHRDGQSLVVRSEHRDVRSAGGQQHDARPAGQAGGARRRSAPRPATGRRGRRR